MYQTVQRLQVTHVTRRHVARESALSRLSTMGWGPHATRFSVRGTRKPKLGLPHPCPPCTCPQRSRNCRETSMPRSIYHTLSSPVWPPRNPRVPFVCCLYTDCTYTSVFQTIFCSPLVRLQPNLLYVQPDMHKPPS